MAPESNTQIYVWSKAVRLFHWSLLALVVVSVASAEELESLHVASGLMIVGLLLFRLLLGLFSKHKYSRFDSWVISPAAALRYLKSMAAGDGPRYVGHNPAGSVMAVLLMLVLAVQALSGFLLWSAEGHGPLAGLAHQWEELFEEFHEVNVNLLYLLVMLHVAGAVVSGKRHGENLVRAMISGYKRR